MTKIGRKTMLMFGDKPCLSALRVGLGFSILLQGCVGTRVALMDKIPTLSASSPHCWLTEPLAESVLGVIPCCNPIMCKQSCGNESWSELDLHFL